MLHPAPSARTAGLLYLLILAAGLSSELLLRMPAQGALDLAPHAMALRWSVLLDLAMLSADVALALLLYRLLAPMSQSLSAVAMLLRLLQAAMIGAALILLAGAARLAASDAPLARVLLDLHGLGYDLGLVFFGANALITARLLCASTAPRVLPPLIFGAGVVYLFGSVTRLIAPEINALMQPAYALCILGEAALCLWLLSGPAIKPREAQSRSASSIEAMS